MPNSAASRSTPSAHTAAPSATQSMMLISDIDHSRRRLHYYHELKAKSGYEKSKAVTKWIEIYNDRLGKLERQATRLGLKTLIKAGIKPAGEKREQVSA